MTPVSDSWDGHDSRIKRLLSPRVVTWLWLAAVSACLAVALIVSGRDSDRQDRDIIAAGSQAVLQNCLDNNRDIRAQLSASNRNIHELVSEGALSRRLGRLALENNRDRLRMASDERCYIRSRRFERQAYGGSHSVRDSGKASH